MFQTACCIQLEHQITSVSEIDQKQFGCSLKAIANNRFCQTANQSSMLLSIFILLAFWSAFVGSHLFVIFTFPLIWAGVKWLCSWPVIPHARKPVTHNDTGKNIVAHLIESIKILKGELTNNLEHLDPTRIQKTIDSRLWSTITISPPLLATFYPRCHTAINRSKGKVSV